MTSEILDVGRASSYPLAMDGPFLWLLFAFAVFAVGTLVLMMVGSIRNSLTRETVSCPIAGKRAEVWVRRKEDGRPAAVKTCSLASPPGFLTCDRGCLSQVRS